MTHEAPKKYTAINDITGNLIKSRGTNQDKYSAGWEAVFGKKLVEQPLTSCSAHRDGECYHKRCPQLMDNEPHRSGRHCPLDNYGGGE